MVIRILKTSFSDKLAAQLNWKGKGNKLGIASHMLAKVIVVSCFFVCLRYIVMQETLCF